MLRRRLAAGSVVAFAGLVGLASGHHVGSTKRRPLRPGAQRASAAPTRWFDQQDQSYSFSDPSTAAAPPDSASSQSAPPPPPPPPPVAQTSVS